MIKTIKVKKQLRLDELIKYAWDNQLNKLFVSDKGLKSIGITLDSVDCRSLDNGIISRHDTFTVEVEITEDMVFQTLIEIDKWQESHEHTCESIIGAKDEDTIAIYALIEFRLQLIWEREENVI